MAENYEILLGVKLDTDGLREKINSLNNKYKLDLGVNVKTSEIRKQISDYSKNSNNAKLHLKVKLDDADLKKQLRAALGNTKTGDNALKLNTDSLDKSLREVGSTIKEIKTALGSLDNVGDLSSIVGSVNQIATALGKVENESDNLVKSLSALSKKDFSVNFDLKMGKSASQISSEQGDIKRDAISQLKQQAKALEDYLDQYYKVSQKQEGVVKLTQGTNLFSTFWEMSPNIGNAKASLKQQVSTYKQYIDLMQEAAKIKGIDLSGIISGFSKTTSDIIEETKKVSNGAEEVKQAFKGIFGGSLDVEGLAGQLQPIITDLDEIKTVIQGLSSNNSIDGLTQSFNRLSETLEKLTSNFALAKNTLDTVFSNTAPVNNAVKMAQQTGQKIGETISKSAKQSINFDDILDEQTLALMNKYSIVGDKGSNAFKEIKQALVECRNELNILKNSDIGIDEEVFDTSRAVDKVSDAIANQMRVINDLGDEYVKLAKYMANFNDPAKGNKVRLPDFVKQEQGDDYRSNRGSLGIAFNTQKGISFADFINDLNHELGETINLTNGEAAAMDELLRKLEIGRQQKRALEQSEKYRTSTASTEEIFEQNGINREEIYGDVMSSVDIISDAEQKIAQSSAEVTNSVVRNEERKQQAYRESSGVISNLKTTLEGMKVDRSSIDAIIKDVEELGFTVTDTSVKMKNGKFDITVNGIDDVGKAITEIRRFSETDGISFVDRKISQSLAKTEKFVKQQRKAVADLTNDINELNRKSIDPNEAKPIKDSSHLDSLKLQYNKVVEAIEKMGRASNDNDFQAERNNVNALISEYRSLAREYKNAETVATSLRSKDIDTVKSTYASKLDVLTSKMREDGVYTSGFEKGAKNLHSVLSNATDASGLVSFLNGLDKIEAGYKRATAAKKEFNKSKAVGGKVSGLESEIKNLQRIDSEINNFETEINGAKVSVKSLLSDLKQVKTQGDFNSVKTSFMSFKKAAEAAGISVKEIATKAKSVEDIKFKLDDTGFDGFKQEIQRAHTEADRLKKSLSGLDVSFNELDSALRRLDAAMESVNFADEANDAKKLVSANKEYEAALKQVYSQLKLNQQIEKDSNKNTKLNQEKAKFALQLDKWLQDNSSAAKEFGTRIHELRNQISACDDIKLGNLKREFQSIDREADLAGKKTKTFTDRIKDQFHKYSAYFGIAEIFMYAEQGLRDMFEQVKLIDSAMTELKKVTDETDSSYNQFLTNAASRAKEIGTTIDGLVSSTADFARLGYDFADAQGLAEVANIYTVVGDEIDGVETATQSLISTMAAFKDEMNGMSDADFAMDIVDKFNEVDILAS